MLRSGLAKRASTCEERAVRGSARFLVGRWERGSAEVGMDSGIGSDIAGGGEGISWGLFKGGRSDGPRNRRPRRAGIVETLAD